MVRALVQDYATFRADLPDDEVEQGGRLVHRLFGRRPDEKPEGVLNVFRPVLAAAPLSDFRWTTKAVYLAR